MAMLGDLSISSALAGFIKRLELASWIRANLRED